MHNFKLVEGLHSERHLREVQQNSAFVKKSFVVLKLLDSQRQVSPVRILHHQTEARGRLVYESGLVTDDVRVSNAGEESDFGKRILLLSL